MRKLALIFLLIVPITDSLHSQGFPRCGYTQNPDGRGRFYGCGEYGPWLPPPSNYPYYRGWRGNNYPWSPGGGGLPPRRLDFWGRPVPGAGAWWQW